MHSSLPFAVYSLLRHNFFVDDDIHTLREHKSVSMVSLFFVLDPVLIFCSCCGAWSIWQCNWTLFAELWIAPSTLTTCFSHPQMWRQIDAFSIHMLKDSLNAVRRPLKPYTVLSCVSHSNLVTAKRIVAQKMMFIWLAWCLCQSLAIQIDWKDDVASGVFATNLCEIEEAHTILFDTLISTPKPDKCFNA